MGKLIKIFQESNNSWTPVDNAAINGSTRKKNPGVPMRILTNYFPVKNKGRTWQRLGWRNFWPEIVGSKGAV